MLTLREVADKLRLDEETVRSRILSGELVAIKAGNARTSPYRISEEALADYIRRQTVQPAEAAS